MGAGHMMDSARILVWLVGLGASLFLMRHGSRYFVRRLAGLWEDIEPIESLSQVRRYLVETIFALGLGLVSIALLLSIKTDVLSLLVWMLFLCCLSVLGVIDAQTRLLPNELNLTLMLMGLSWQAFQSPSGMPELQSLWGMVLGYGVPVLLNLASKFFRGHTAIGLGDAKLLAGLGVWLGAWSLPVLWVIACAVTLVYTGSVWIVSGRWQSSVPFGPFLALAGAMVVLINHV